MLELLSSYIIYFILALASSTSYECEVCNMPFYQGVDSVSVDHARVVWLDFNPNAGYWDIEFGEKGFSPTGTPTHSNIPETNFDFTDLLSGSSYDVYLRSVCDDGTISSWVGPRNFNTLLQNPSNCARNLLIRDNVCNASNEYGILVENYENFTLGEDLFISSVDLIIEHYFPSDLELRLISPEGKEILLSEANGIGSNHYGDPFDDSCSRIASFSMESCVSITEAPKPYIGSFKPEDDFGLLYPSSEVNGVWKLVACDNVAADQGYLRYANIVFSSEICPIVENIHVKNIDASRAEIFWQMPDNASCESIEIEYGPEGFLSGEGTSIQLDCGVESHMLQGLEPLSTYEYQISSHCSNDISSISCRYQFSTECHDVSFREDFDNQNICPISCNNECSINGFWYNDSSNILGWNIWEGATNSDFTGPESDVTGYNKYIYLESFGPDCSNSETSILLSSCLLVESNLDGCDMAFNSFMFGEDVQSLSLEISIDGGINWEAIWTKTGNQGPFWEYNTVDLSSYDQSLVLLRFIGLSSEGSLGDIALDDIRFYGSNPVESGGNIFFVDQDMDDFGNPDEAFQFCRMVPPEGFVINSLDCDDSNEFINPDITEIPCNLIDDNCNGIEDDDIEINPIIIELESIVSEFCNQSFDGEIYVQITGGQAPYSYFWSNESESEDLIQLSSGYYQLRVQDDNGCEALSDSFFVGIANDYEIAQFSITQPSCFGASDGQIELLETAGTEPFQYSWSRGDESEILTNVSDGSYYLTLTDANNCQIVSDPILIVGDLNLNAGVVFLDNTSCFGTNDGAILLAVNGGEPPYSFDWSNGDSDNFINFLEAGKYNCTITDANDCQIITDSLQISSPDSLEVSVLSREHNNCFGGTDGEINVEISGGTPPFAFEWSNSQFSQNLSHLAAGFYSLTVTDANLCVRILENVEIFENDQLQINLTENTGSRCRLSQDGYLEVDATGGGGSYQYFWSTPNAEDNSADMLNAGFYSVTVIDQFGCKQTLKGIELENNNELLEITLELNNSNLCYLDSLSSISANILDGNAPFQYNWSNGVLNNNDSSIDTLTDLSSGTYQLTVTDNQGCTAISEQVSVDEIDPINFQLIDIQYPLCTNDSTAVIHVNAFGGSGELKYKWSTGDSTGRVENLPSGIYTLIIEDSNDCELGPLQFEIPEGSSFNIQTESVAASNGMPNGSATINVSNGTPPYQIEWDENTNFQSGPTANNLAPGVYYASITDDINCQKDTFVVVDNLDAVEDIKLETAFNIFPNPTKNILNLKVNENISGQLQLILIDSKGQEFKNIRLELTAEGLIQLETQDLPSGVYYVSMYTNSKELIGRKSFIKLD